MELGIILKTAIRRFSTLFFPADVLGRVEASEKSGRKKYNPRQHTNFYVVASDLIQHLLDENLSSKTARQFAEATGYAESTIRSVCKLLVEEGVFKRTQEFPAAYALVSVAAGRNKWDEYQSRLISASKPTSE